MLNGLAAAWVHFATLAFLVEVVSMQNVGFANMVAAVAGSGASFLGNRYYVFRAIRESALSQFGKFWLLYATIAIFHGAFLYVWADRFAWDYRVGFVVGAALQTIFTYVGGRWWVFKPEN